jgi:hypothetical protein
MKILDEEIHLKENLGISLKRYRFWWAILLVTMILDYLTTLNFVDKYGVITEGNLVVVWLIKNLGPGCGVFVGKLLQLAAVTIFVCLHQKLGNLFLLVVILFNCWAVAVNIL